MKIGEYKIIDDYLSKEDLKFLQNQFFSNEFPYFFCNEINDRDSKNFYFDHHLFNGELYSPFFQHIWPVFEKNRHKFLNEDKDLKLIRAKVNCYPRTNKVEMHGPHKDYPLKDNLVALFFVNTTDAPTHIMPDTQIDNIENRLVLFNGHTDHSSSSPTDSKVRVTININYQEILKG